MLSQVVINQGNFALQNRAENVVQTVVHCFSIMLSNKLIINRIIPLSQSPLGSPHQPQFFASQRIEAFHSRHSHTHAQFEDNFGSTYFLLRIAVNNEIFYIFECYSK